MGTSTRRNCVRAWWQMWIRVDTQLTKGGDYLSSGFVSGAPVDAHWCLTALYSPHVLAVVAATKSQLNSQCMAHVVVRPPNHKTTVSVSHPDGQYSMADYISLIAGDTFVLKTRTGTTFLPRLSTTSLMLRISTMLFMPSPLSTARGPTTVLRS
jgi:hypothetical protein